MQTVGRVMKVRESSFNGRDGKPVSMLYLDVYDDTAGLIQCEMLQNGPHPVKDDMVVGEVSRAKPTKFGGGVSFVLAKVLRPDGSGFGPVSASADVVPPVPSAPGRK